MKNKKLQLSDFAQKAKALTEKEQKAVKGGNKFTGNALHPFTTKWIEVDIRAANPTGLGTDKGKSLRKITRI